LLVHSLDLPALPSGLWYDDGKVDHIICRGGVVGYHHDHVILHEVCHLLAGHNSRLPARGSAEVAGPLKCALDRDHAGYQEELAEVFASMVLRLVNLRPAPVSEFERRAAAMFGAA
jgi:hypothetical protein